MAVDLVSVPFSSQAGPRSSKRRRLGWDVPDPALLAELARMQWQVAYQLIQEVPLLTSIQEQRLTSVSKKNNGYRICDGVVQSGKVEAEICHHSKDNQGLQCSPRSPLLLHEDDQDGHLNYAIGGSLTSRYKILRKMGEGTFGRVLECFDKDSQDTVAIKVIRSAKRYQEAARIEIEVLQILHENDKRGSRGCVQMRRWFEYRNHTCIVFEKLGPSLYDFLRANEYRPFSLDLVRDFGQQLLESVAYMHSLSLVHTDLKPENVLLASADYIEVHDRKNCFKQTTQRKQVPKSSRIKLIDFGSATYDREFSFSTVSTRHYRAPEVILGCGWSYPCDIWSVACILVELCSGKVLFQTHKNLEHLAMMERVFGAIPSYVVRRSKGKAFKYFRHERSLDWPASCTTTESIQAVERLPKLRDLLLRHVDKVPNSFINLLERMFCYDPFNRLSAREALNHPFFKEREVLAMIC